MNRKIPLTDKLYYSFRPPSAAADALFDGAPYVLFTLSSDFYNLYRINLEGLSITHYISRLTKLISSQQYCGIFGINGEHFNARNHKIYFSSELEEYLHKNAWIELFSGLILPPSEFTPLEPIPDLLKDL